MTSNADRRAEEDAAAIAAYVAEVVDRAPPLSAGQIAKLQALFDYTPSYPAQASDSSIQ